MNGQKEINKYNNLLGIGMIDGSVLVWDCELHTDKFLLQKIQDLKLQVFLLMKII